MNQLPTIAEQSATDAGDCVVAMVLFGVVVFMLIMEKCQKIKTQRDRALWIEARRRVR